MTTTTHPITNQTDPLTSSPDQPAEAARKRMNSFIQVGRSSTPHPPVGAAARAGLTLRSADHVAVALGRGEKQDLPRFV